MRQYPGAACLAAAVVLTSFVVIDANIRATEAAFDSNIGSACVAAANRPAFCPAVRPGSPATERISPWVRAGI